MTNSGKEHLRRTHFFQHNLDFDEHFSFHSGNWGNHYSKGEYYYTQDRLYAIEARSKKLLFSLIFFPFHLKGIVIRFYFFLNSVKLKKTWLIIYFLLTIFL